MKSALENKYLCLISFLLLIPIISMIFFQNFYQIFSPVDYAEVNSILNSIEKTDNITYVDLNISIYQEPSIGKETYGEKIIFFEVKGETKGDRAREMSLQRILLDGGHDNCISENNFLEKDCFCFLPFYNTSFYNYPSSSPSVSTNPGLNHLNLKASDKDYDFDTMSWYWEGVFFSSNYTNCEMIRLRENVVANITITLPGRLDVFGESDPKENFDISQDLENNSVYPNSTDTVSFFVNTTCSGRDCPTHITEILKIYFCWVFSE